nr:MAG TPA: hypothetical protein [Caudoviricetes sp.]DAV00960.1 MAG TPA: hypothetical protein [Caudoviricetes sp.]
MRVPRIRPLTKSRIALAWRFPWQWRLSTICARR